MNVKNTPQPSKIYLIKSNNVLILSNILGHLQGVNNENLGVLNPILANHTHEIKAIPYKLLNHELCTTYAIPPGSALDIELFNWLYHSGIEFRRTSKGKYRFLLIGAQVKELINHINAIAC